MMDAGEDLVEAFGDAMQVAEGELTIVELPVGKDLVDQVLDQSLDPGRGGVLQSSRRRFHHIGQHDQPGFPGLGFWARVPEIVDLDGVFSLLLFGFFVKIANDAGSMVLLDGVDDGLSQLVLPSQLYTGLDVRDQDQARHGRCQLVMPVLSIDLVFYEIEGLLELADVMVVAAHLGQKRVGADIGGSGFHQRSYDDRMVVGPRRFDHQSPEEGLIEVGQL